jgi:solute carrier family 50 protein (sugar transporter)
MLVTGDLLDGRYVGSLNDLLATATPADKMEGGAGVMVVRVWVACSTLAMAYLPSLFVRRIHKTRDTGSAPLIPLLSLLVNSHVWVMYAYMCKTWFPSFPVFLTGDVAALCYLFIFWRFSSERRRVGRTIALVAAVLLLPSIYVLVGGLGLTGQTRAEVGKSEGYVCVVAVVALHLVMLKNLLNVVRMRSAASLNLRTLAVGTVNTYGWFTFGYVTSNWIISGPHVFVMVLHTAALVLYIVLRPSTHLVAASSNAIVENDHVVVDVELSPKTGVDASSKVGAISSPEYQVLRSPLQQ